MSQNIKLDVTRQFRLYFETVQLCQKSTLEVYDETTSTENTGEVGNAVSTARNSARINTIVTTLMNALEERGKDFSTRGGQYGLKLYQRVIYVFAAFADEMMLDHAWDGRDQWLKNPLEVRLFGTQSAGEELFEDIDNGLAAYELGRSDLATVYLMALNLGFKGRFRGTGSEEKINSYKRRLFALIRDRDPSLEEAGTTFLGTVYQYNQTGGAPRFMPYLRPWVISIAVVVGLYILGSHLIWDLSVTDLDRQVRDLTIQLNP